MPEVLTHVMTDIRGYSRILHRVGQDEATKWVRAYERVVRSRLPNESHEIDHVADAFHLVFKAPRDAVRVSIDIGDAMAEHNRTNPQMVMSVGIGIDAAESIARSGRRRGSAASFFPGSAPVVASRLARSAEYGQVLMSQTVQTLVGRSYPTRDLGVWQIPNFSAVHVFEARPPDLASAERPHGERFLSALLYTDMVRSTATAIALGDRQWRVLVERHHAIVREELERHGGSEIDTAGDGFYASFTAPSRAVQCAIDLQKRMRESDLDVRAGVHVGECEIIAGKIGGAGAVVGARVKDLADAGEILVSRTVRDLLIGTPFAFEPRGAHQLKGLPGEWEIYALRTDG